MNNMNARYFDIDNYIMTADNIMGPWSKPVYVHSAGFDASIFHDDDGNEKSLRYKVLLWANDLSQANERAHHLVYQGYDMQIEGIKEVEYEFLTDSIEENEEG